MMAGVLLALFPFLLLIDTRVAFGDLVLAVVVIYRRIGR